MADQIVEMEKSIEKDENSSTEVYPSSRNSQRSGTLFNIFALKKAAAQGMMDVALMTSNANQLRYLMEYGPRSWYRGLILMISTYYLKGEKEVIVGIILIMKGRSDFRRRSTFRRQKTKHDIQLNQCVGVGVFLITVVNVFIAAFGVNVASPTMQPVQTSSQTKDK
ncbi:ninjurin-2-like [Planococcus citri]|uniref:ninjurin-2-like n=1 Tax=Planococcus citri TaxID=170843 RepID=UPI0031F976C4